ncbi:MAG: hypothetical protein QOI71_622, partial [Gaiellales bacterium]|nr:hypothetical protein [Gaiellales bacterium]
FEVSIWVARAVERGRDVVEDVVENATGADSEA